MAITKTTTVREITVLVTDSSDYTTSTLCLTLLDSFDDPNDAELPLRKSRRVNIERGTDLTSYPQFVQDVAATVWGS